MLDAGPKIKFFLTADEAIAEQFRGRGEGAEQIGTALLYVKPETSKRAGRPAARRRGLPVAALGLLLLQVDLDRFRPLWKADSGTITETSSPASPTASVNVLPTARIVPFTATAMSRGCLSGPLTLPTM